MGKRELYEYNGKQMTLSQVERITGKDAETLRRRIRLGGMTLEEALRVEGRAVYSLDVLDRKKQQRKESGYCKRIALLLMREIFYGCTPREVGFMQMPEVVAEAVARNRFIASPTYDDYVMTNAEIRKIAEELIK